MKDIKWLTIEEHELQEARNKEMEKGFQDYLRGYRGNISPVDDIKKAKIVYTDPYEEWKEKKQQAVDTGAAFHETVNRLYNYYEKDSKLIQEPISLIERMKPWQDLNTQLHQRLITTDNTSGKGLFDQLKQGNIAIYEEELPKPKYIWI